MAAEVVVPEQDRAAVEAAVAEWNHEVWPENVAERSLLRRVAVSDVRLKRSEDAEQQSLDAVAREAVRAWVDRKQKAARKRAQAIADDPIDTVLDLEGSAFGCQWLIRHWSRLDRRLEQGLGWSEADRATAMRLIGFFPAEPGPDGDAEARWLWRASRLASGLEVGPSTEDDGEDDEPRDPVAARAAVRGFIAGQLDRLEGRAAESWEAVEGPERQAVIASSLAGDPSRSGQLQKRYERDAQGVLLRSLGMVIRIRKRRDEMAERDRKIARESPVATERVGGGWWHEKGAAPCPPGFRPDGRPSPSDRPSAASPPPVPSPRPTAPGPFPSVSSPAGTPPRPSAPGPVTADPARRAASQAPSTPPPPVASSPRPVAIDPQRSEPISGPDRAAGVVRNPITESELRRFAVGRPPAHRERTVPPPRPDRPHPRPPIDRDEHPDRDGHRSPPGPRSQGDGLRRPVEGAGDHPPGLVS